MSGRLWHYANSDGVPKRPLIVALAVGTILNPINQGDALVGGAALNVATLLPAYGVPFCVAPAAPFLPPARRRRRAGRRRDLGGHQCIARRPSPPGWGMVGRYRAAPKWRQCHFSRTGEVR